MIDIKKTLDAANLSQYKLAQWIDRPRQQVNVWYLGKHKPSGFAEEKLRQVFAEHGIEVIED